MDSHNKPLTLLKLYKFKLLTNKLDFLERYEAPAESIPRVIGQNRHFDEGLVFLFNPGKQSQVSCGFTHGCRLLKSQTTPLAV